ncbi:MAG: ATP-binding protein [Halioglobus sp.]
MNVTDQFLIGPVSLKKGVVYFRQSIFLIISRWKTSMNIQQVASPALVNSDTTAMLEAEYLNKLLDQERSVRLDAEQRLELKTGELSSLEKRHQEMVQILSDQCRQTFRELPAAQEGGLGTITCDLSNGTTTFSDCVYSILGLELNDVPLDISRLIAMVHGDDRARVKKYFECRGSQEYSRLPISTEFRICLEDGQQRWVEVHSELTAIDCGEKDLRLITFQDVSQKKIQDEKLRRSEALAVEKLAELEGLQSDLVDSRDKAEKASQTKSRFLAVMSHEIRTPLNGVLGSLQLLSDADLKAPEQELVNVATSSAENLCRIANDVIELSRMEAGRLDLELMPFDVFALISEVSDFWRPMADGKGLAIESSVGSRIPQFLLGDPARIRQIINNYMSNAIKFTDQGDICLRLALDEGSCSSDPSELRVRLEVRDTGTGIAQSNHKLLFQDFTQLPESVDSERSGAGLGLAICRGLASRMGGTVGVRSESGVGSTFWVTVPLQRAADPKDYQAKRHESAELIPLLNIAGRPAHVLLVEDVFTNQVIADAFLRGWGCHVDIAENGAEALSAIQECLYDVVLMDVTMPIMDGVEATLQIRASAMEQAQLPIVGLTAYAHEEEKKAFLAAGMNDVIHKPLNKNELHEALSFALASSQENSASRHTVKQPSSYLDRAILDELRDSLSVDKMNHLMGRIMIDIKNNHEEAIVGAKSGNAERVGRACHALKGMGGSFGSPELSRLAGEIQLAWRKGESEKVMAMALSDLDHMCARLIVALESYKRSIVRI